MEQTPIFVTVEEDLGITYATLVSPPYEFAKHDAEVRRRIAARKDADLGQHDLGAAWVPQTEVPEGSLGQH